MIGALACLWPIVAMFFVACAYLKFMAWRDRRRDQRAGRRPVAPLPDETFRRFTEPPVAERGVAAPSRGFVEWQREAGKRGWQ